jgi:hypothetical protein
VGASEQLNRCAHDGKENHWLDETLKVTLCSKRFVEGKWDHNFYGIHHYCDICFAPKVSVPRACGGWVSPKGEFYPCGTYEHISAAIRLGDQSGGAGLEAEGWIHIFADGDFWVKEENRSKLSQDVLDLLGDILKVARTEARQTEFRQEFMEHFRKAFLRILHES